MAAHAPTTVSNAVGKRPLGEPARKLLDSILACTLCGASLEVTESEARCTCGHRLPIRDRIVTCLEQADEFYEGAYDRQISHVPGRSRLRDLAFFKLVQSGVLGDIRRVLRRGDVVLDVGCAGGIRWLGQEASVVGVDLSGHSLRKAVDVYSAGIQADVRTLPLRKGTVDLVYSSYFFEHIPFDDKAACLASFRAVLRPGGYCVLQFDTLSDGPLYRFAQSDPAAFDREFIRNDGHVGLEPLTQNLERMKRAGFEVTTVHTFGTTWLQYAATYQWLDKAYGDRYPAVRAAGAMARASKKLGPVFEFGVTMFDRAIAGLRPLDGATRAIVVLRSP